jgi:hypothetical protein
MESTRIAVHCFRRTRMLGTRLRRIWALIRFFLRAESQQQNQNG